jgi:hypothetical protein
LPIKQKIANGIAQLAQESEEEEEEEEPIQAKYETVQRQPNATDGKPRPNNTGLPDNLKSGIEALSGLSLDHVRVHYNSAQPAQLNALAYAQGSDIHLAPGQEQHLPHEAWHIVQQAQGRVQPTMQIQDGVPVNDEAGLEREADLMGGRASNVQAPPRRLEQAVARLDGLTHLGAGAQETMVVQREPNKDEKEKLKARVLAKYHEYKFETRTDGRELAIGYCDYYMLIRTGQDFYWRQYKLKQTTGRGFFGRLGDNPPTMNQIAESHNLKEALQSTLLKNSKSINFTPVTPNKDRDNNNNIMGKYFLNCSRPMSATVYARKVNCEWLHMHSHGLGGDEVPENLYAGSHAANSHMAAIENAVNSAHRMLPNKSITINVMVSTNADHHNEKVCNAIAVDLKLDSKDVCNLMKKRESHMLEFIEYQVAVEKKTVWTERILPFQVGRFDEAQFNKLYQRVIDAILGKPKTIEFVSGGTLLGSSYGGGSGGGMGGGTGMGSSDMEM